MNDFHVIPGLAIATILAGHRDQVLTAQHQAVGARCPHEHHPVSARRRSAQRGEQAAGKGRGP